MGGVGAGAQARAGHWTTPRAACSLFLVLVSVVGAQGAIHGYSGGPFTDAGHGAYIFRGGREGLFESTEEAPSSIHTVNKQVSNGRSYIRLAKLEFERPKRVAKAFRMMDGDTGLVEALVFEVQDRELIGHVMEDGSRRFCCTEDLAPKIRCTTGRLIVKDHSDGWRNTPWTLDITFQGNETVAHAPGAAMLPITDTGMYHLWFVTCNPELKKLKVEGQTTWKNPHGYLPGMMAPLLGFYGVMSLAMLALGFVWFGLYAFHWRDIIPLQHCISALIFLSMLEVFVWYFDFVNFNVSGFRPYVTTLWAVLLGSLRKSIARVLVLVVSMGYGVVRPTLGGYSTQVQGLCIAYFIAVAVLDIVTHVGTIDDLPSMLRVLLVTPVASLDAVLILWTFVSLSKTLTQLSARKQTTKLNLYRAFTNTLAIAVWVSICWIAYEMYFKITDSTNTEKWESYWVTDAFWQILTYAVMLVICWLWRPSKNSQCYDYSEADGDIFADDGIEMRESGAMTVNTDVFSIDDDAEGEGAEKMS